MFLVISILSQKQITIYFKNYVINVYCDTVVIALTILLSARALVARIVLIYII